MASDLMAPRAPFPVQRNFGVDLNGTLIPNKVFIGGLAEKTTERDLRDIFSAMVDVKEVKIITDRSLNSKSGEPRRYAFIELQNEKDDKKIPEDVKLVVDHFAKKDLDLHGRRLNVGLAYKKVPTFGRVFGPGIAAPAFYASEPYSMESIYLQMLAIQQQKLAAQNPYSYYQPPSPYSSAPFMVPQQTPGGSPTMMSYQGMYPTPVTQSGPLSPRLTPYSGPASPLGMRSDGPHMTFAQPCQERPYMANGTGNTDQRHSTDRQLYRTVNGFIEGDPQMMRAHQVHYGNHH